MIKIIERKATLFSFGSVGRALGLRPMGRRFETCFPYLRHFRVSRWRATEKLDPFRMKKPVGEAFVQGHSTYWTITCIVGIAVNSPACHAGNHGFKSRTMRSGRLRVAPSKKILSSNSQFEKFSRYHARMAEWQTLGP